jgi:hypothetical protein
MGIQLKNNTSGTLATAINASDIGIVLTAGNGANFPALGIGDYFYATLESTGGTFEVVKVTARSGDSMTVLRAQEGSIANSFAAGSRLELRITAQTVIDTATQYAGDADQNLRNDLAAATGSSLVGFQQGGVSAVLRTTQAKLRETVSVKDFGAVGDGVTDDTAAIQAAIDAVGDNGTVEFSQATSKYLFTEVVVDRVGVTLCGNGVLDGSIKVRHFNYNITNSIEQFVTIDGLQFVSSGNTKNAIVLNSTARGRIINCRFVGFDSAIYVPQNTDNVYGQHVRRYVISNNTYSDVNYFVREVKTAGITFSFADNIISCNEGVALVRHVDLDTVDGVTIADNIFFFPGFQTANATKEHSVYIKFGVWIQIHDNKFFESGWSGVVLEECSRFSLHDNLYAWPGQRLESPAILITGTPIAGAYFTDSVIHNENIIEPTGQGITVGAKSGRLSINNCYMNKPNAATNSRYYGVAPLSGLEIGLSVNADTIQILTNDNSIRWGNVSLSFGLGTSNVNRDNVVDPVGDGSGVTLRTALRTLTLSGTETSVDVTKFDVVNLNQSAPTSITDVVNSSGNAKQIIFRSFNGNTTFVHDTNKLHLAGSANVTLGTKDTLTLWCESAAFATELARAV